MSTLLNDRRITGGLAATAIVVLGLNILAPLFGGEGSRSDGVPAYALDFDPPGPAVGVDGVVTAVNAPRPEITSLAFGGAAIGGRDPFVLQPALPVAAGATTRAKTEPVTAAEAGPKLSAIVVSSSFRLAIIDGQFVREGTLVNGQGVTRIDASGVSLADGRGDTTTRLAMNEIER